MSRIAPVRAPSSAGRVSRASAARDKCIPANQKATNEEEKGSPLRVRRTAVRRYPRPCAQPETSPDYHYAGLARFPLSRLTADEDAVYSPRRVQGNMYMYNDSGNLKGRWTMNRRIAGWFVILALAALCVSVCASEEYTEDGEIQLQDSANTDPGSLQIFEVGEKTVFQVNAYMEDFFGDMVINANAKLINRTKVQQDMTYAITFYDEEGNVIGAFATTVSVAPKEETMFGSALIKGTREDFEKITNYRLYICSNKTVADK